MSVSERLREIRVGFERPFWIANISELFERLSYYAAFASLARYLHETLQFPVERTRGWYDLAVSVQGDPQFEYRYAGHLETGEASISDPGMGGLI